MFNCIVIVAVTNVYHAETQCSPLATESCPTANTNDKIEISIRPLYSEEKRTYLKFGKIMLARATPSNKNVQECIMAKYFLKEYLKYKCTRRKVYDTIETGDYS